MRPAWFIHQPGSMEASVFSFNHLSEIPSRHSSPTKMPRGSEPGALENERGFIVAFAWFSEKGAWNSLYQGAATCHHTTPLNRVRAVYQALRAFVRGLQQLVGRIFVPGVSMSKKIWLTALALHLNLGYAQTQIDFPYQQKKLAGTTLPATCSAGQLFLNLSSPAGQNVYVCTGTNQWTLEGGSGGGALTPSFNVTTTSSSIAMGPGACLPRQTESPRWREPTPSPIRAGPIAARFMWGQA